MPFQVIEKNKLILARRMYNSEKGWTKAMRHCILLLASEVELSGKHLLGNERL